MRRIPVPRVTQTATDIPVLHYGVPPPPRHRTIVRPCENGLEISDPQLPLWRLLLEHWLYLLIYLWIGVCLVGSSFLLTEFRSQPMLLNVILAGLISMAAFSLTFYTIGLWHCWRRPTSVRIQDGTLFITCGLGSRPAIRHWPVADVARVVSSHDVPSTLTIYSIIVYFKTTRRITVLHCRNKHEGRWVVGLLEHAMVQYPAPEVLPDVANCDPPYVSPNPQPGVSYIL